MKKSKLFQPDNRKCKQCGFTGHKKENCEYPFPQGHAAQQQRNEDWSILSHQVVGAEVFPPKKSK